MIFIVGLGNPGKEYQQTRHNIGFVILDAFLKQLGGPSAFIKFNSEIVKHNYQGNDILLVKPLSFMNNSGTPVSSAVAYYGNGPEQILIIHDDIDIEFGRIILKSGGGTGGHNGLESVASRLGNSDFDRLRFGLGRPPGKKDPADFVLSNFSKKERAEIAALVEKASDAISDYILFGTSFAMNKYNSQ